MVFLHYSVNLVNCTDGFMNLKLTLVFLLKISLGQDAVSSIHIAGFNLLTICNRFLYLCQGMLVWSFLMSAPIDKYGLSFTNVSQTLSPMPTTEKVFYREIVSDGSQRLETLIHSFIHSNYLKH